MRILVLLFALLLVCRVAADAPDVAIPEPGVTKVPLVFSGGHETDPRDHGRPVVLIAHALKVTPDVFRQAFSGVHPAQRDGGPTDGEARANKKVLMDALSPYGVTDERLNEVSNHYRYRRDKGQMWPTTPAAGYIYVNKDGTVIDGAVITDAGSGYSSPPTVKVEGKPGIHVTVKLSFDTDFAKNGAVADPVVVQEKP